MSEIPAQDIQVVRYVVGDKNNDFKSTIQRHCTDGSANEIAEITEYYVELPAYFAHGFPNVWNFSIVRIKVEVVDDPLRRKLVNRLTRIVDAHPVQKGIPVLFISTTDAFQVANELPPNRLNIFGIDIADQDFSIGKQAGTTPPHLSALIAPIKKSLTNQQWQEFWLSPYRRSTPADGWRFFGRRKELRKITESLDNFVVVGARRIGKTSLLKELARTLEDQGYTVYSIDMQFSSTERDLVNKLLEKLDSRTSASLLRRQEVVSASVLEHALRMLSGRGNTALLIDEIGNLLKSDPVEAWKTLGTLRSFLHNGNIKLVCTASQTFLLKQQQDYAGPWVNFANTLLLRGLTREETEEFVLAPLKIWRSMTKMECDDLFNLVYHNVGSHPLLLTAFCEALFARVVGRGAHVLAAARELLGCRDEGLTKAIKEVFFEINRPIVQYIFLQHCLERSAANEALMLSTISETWVNKALQNAGYKTRLATRLFLLEALNTRALTEPDPDREDQCRVIAPFVYIHSRTRMSLEEKRDTLREEISLDVEEYELVRTLPR